MKHKLPDGWREKRLSEVSRIIVSNVDKKVNVDEIPVTLCNYMDVYRRDYIDQTVDYMGVTATQAEIEKFSLVCGDVIITKDSETPEDIAESAVVTEITDNFLCGYHLAIIRPTKELHGMYLSKQINTRKLRSYFSRFANGATRFGLNIGVIENAIIPLPPLEEQRKIADILGTVDDKLASIDQQITATETLKKGLMQQLFTKGIGHTEFKETEIGTIPKAWEVVKFGDVAKLQGGFAFKSSDATKVGIPWVKIANVGVGELVWSETSYLPFEYASDYKDFLLYESDVIIAMTRPLLGNRLKVAVVGSNDTPSLLNQRVGRFLFVGISKWFTFHLIKFQAFIEQLQLSLLGSDPPNISSRQVENIIIPLPPLEEQEKIASILTEVDNKIDSLKKRKSAYTTLKTGLMQQLLTGQKRVKA